MGSGVTRVLYRAVRWARPNTRTLLKAIRLLDIVEFVFGAVVPLLSCTCLRRAFETCWDGSTYRYVLKPTKAGTTRHRSIGTVRTTVPRFSTRVRVHPILGRLFRSLNVAQQSARLLDSRGFACVRARPVAAKPTCYCLQTGEGKPNHFHARVAN